MRFKNEIIIGIISTIAVIALVVGFFFLKGQKIWQKSDSYYAVYGRAEGLTTGNAVVKNGVPVGVITGVELYPNNPDKVLVSFDITTDWVKIPKASIAQLEPGMLGSPQINLLFSDHQDFYASGDTIPAKLKAGVFEAVKDQILERIDPSLYRLNNAIATADSAITIISAVFGRNTDNLDESFDGIKRSILNFERVSLHLDTLMASFTSSRGAMVASLENIRVITDNLKKSNAEITRTIENVANISDSVALMDFAGTLDKAKESLDNVNAILYEIENGEGSLTKLLKDSTLYENVNIMVEEAGRLIENIQEHPNRYVQFAIFGTKDRGVNLSSRDEKILRKYVKDTLRYKYKNAPK